MPVSGQLRPILCDVLSVLPVCFSQLGEVDIVPIVCGKHSEASRQAEGFEVS